MRRAVLLCVRVLCLTCVLLRSVHLRVVCHILRTVYDTEYHALHHSWVPQHALTRRCAHVVADRRRQRPAEHALPVPAERRRAVPCSRSMYRPQSRPRAQPPVETGAKADAVNGRSGGHDNGRRTAIASGRVPHNGHINGHAARRRACFVRGVAKRPRRAIGRVIDTARVHLPYANRTRACTSQNAHLTGLAYT